MELDARTRVPYPRELVFRTIRDKMPSLSDYMPNIKSIEVKERVDADSVVRFVNLWTASADIPAVASKILKPEMLTWIDRAEWSENGFTCDWKIETNALPGLVICQGHNVYNSIGNETELVIKGTLQINMDKAPVPRLLAGTVRPVIERIIISAMKPNLTSIGEAVAAYLKAQGV
jgi:hypothetical protein